MKIKKYLFTLFLLCLCLTLIVIFNSSPNKFFLWAQLTINPYSAQASMPQNILDARVIDTALFDTTTDPSFTNANSSKTYSLKIMDRQQDFTVTAVYGPNPCTPVNEGGNAFYAISICPQASYDAYMPKNVVYKIEFRDFQGNLLKSIQDVGLVEYKQSGLGNNKKVVGWIYGFYKPEDIKAQIGVKPFKMAYQISFVNNDPNNVIKYDLSPMTGASPGQYTFSIAPDAGLAEAGSGITPVAGGGVRAGYGVDVVSGALTNDFIDMALPGNMSITRHYNGAMGYQPGKAFGWMFNFEEILRFDQDGSVFYRNMNFKEYRFANDPNNPGNYIPAKAGNFLRMAKNSEGNYEVIFKDNSKKVFNSIGLLIKTIDRGGNAVSYKWEIPVSQINDGYDMPGRLMAVMGAPDIFRANNALFITDSYGRSVYVYFNKFGRVRQINDWSGRRTEYTWDDARGIYLLKYKNIAGNYIVFSYNGSEYNKLAGIIYPNGAQVNNYYAASNNQAVDRQGVITGGGISYSYGWANNPQEKWTIINNNGKISTYYYDENGSITRIISQGANNNQITYNFNSYHDKNLLNNVTDSLGRSQSYYYDDRGNIIGLKLTNGKNIKLISDDRNRLTGYYDTAGRRTGFVYDDRNNLITIEKKDGSKISFEYNSEGRVTKSIDENKHARTYEYGAYGNLARVTDEEGGVTTFYHDGLGRITALDADGLKYWFEYNNFNGLTKITDARGSSTDISYDNNGNMISTADARGNSVKFDYDALNRLIRQTDAEGAVQSYLYDAEGKITAVIDPMGKDIGFEYNTGGYLANVRDQNFNRIYYSYDAGGNLISVNNPSADKNINFSVDELNRVIQKTSGDTDSYEYDGAGNIKRTKDISGETYYEYDPMDRLTKKVYPSGKEFNRNFDKAGNIIYEKYINGEEINYEYDKSDKLISAKKSGADKLTCAYNQDRHLATVEYPNKVSEYIAYNENKNIVRLKYISSTGEVIYQADYAYNELHQITGKQTFGKGRVKKNLSYVYDNAGRLKEVKSEDRIISEYTYDKNGNRLTSKTSRGIINYSYDGANRLLKENQTLYAYDGAGNLISASSGGKTGSYVYDKENNLISAVLPGGGKNPEVYSYDALSLRAGKTLLGKTASACWMDGKLTGEVNKNGDVLFINYGYGFKNSQGDYYYITDIEGSVVGLTDKRGDIVTVYEYDEFGNPTSSANVAAYEDARQEAQAAGAAPKSMFGKIIDFIKNLFGADKNSGQTQQNAKGPAIFNKVNSPVRFAGYYYDENTALYYVKSRYYNPKTGRFTQPDKLGYAAGLNMYAYCNNDPVNQVDPKGFEGAAPLPGSFTPANLTPVDELIAVGEGDLQYLTGKAMINQASSSAASSVKSGLSAAMSGKLSFLNNLRGSFPAIVVGVAISTVINSNPASAAENGSPSMSPAMAFRQHLQNDTGYQYYKTAETMALSGIGGYLGGPWGSTAASVIPAAVEEAFIYTFIGRNGSGSGNGPSVGSGSGSGNGPSAGSGTAAAGGSARGWAPDANTAATLKIGDEQVADASIIWQIVPGYYQRINIDTGFMFKTVPGAKGYKINIYYIGPPELLRYDTINGSNNTSTCDYFTKTYDLTKPFFSASINVVTNPWSRYRINSVSGNFIGSINNPTALNDDFKFFAFLSNASGVIMPQYGQTVETTFISLYNQCAQPIAKDLKPQYWKAKIVAY